MPTFIDSQPRVRPRLPDESIAFDGLNPLGVGYQFPTGFQEGVGSTLDSIDEAITAHNLGKLMLPQDALAQHRPKLVENLPQETEAQARFYHFLGRTCVKRALESSAEPEVGVSNLTLAKSITEAKKDNMEADARVDISIATATTEAYFKTGHFTRIEKSLNNAGEVVQFGLTTEKMQQDAIVTRPHRPTQLKEFTKAELQNGLREQQLVRDDKLQDSWMVVASLVPKGMPEAWLDHRGDGFFTYSMTYSLQGTTQEGLDIFTETVFDKGTLADEQASYQERQDQRFDLAAFGKVCEWLGLPAPRSELEALQTPLYIPKRLMPNGMIDFWRWMDVAADELRGQQVVRTVDQYRDRVATSAAREASLAEVKAKIKHDLLALDDFERDIEAVEALWELTRKHGYKAAATNQHIEPLAFGIKASRKLLVAKNFISLGEDDEANRWLTFGLEDAIITGCGGSNGGGSCGLRDLNHSSSEFSKAKSLLDFEEGDSVTLDEERPCVKCGTVGSVVYVYNASKVDKCCVDCGAVEFGARK
jgi:hypothetical protein